MRNSITLIFIALLVLITILRVLPLLFGFLDQESLLAVLAMKQAVEIGMIPTHYTTGNFTRPIGFGERPLQIYIVTTPYTYLLHNFLSLIQVTYLVKILFLIANAILIFILCRKITGSSASGLLAILVLAINPIANFFESMSVWLGDSFMPTFILGSILLLLYAKDSKNKLKASVCILLSLILVLAGYYIWDGGLYSIAAYAFVIVMFMANYLLKSLGKAVIAAVVLTIICYTILLPSGYNEGIYSFGTTVTSNIITFLTQQEPVAYSVIPYYPPFYQVAWIAGAIIFVLLPIYATYKFSVTEKDAKRQEAFLAVFSLFIMGVPAAAVTGRFSSLIVLEIAILAGIGLLLEKRKTVLAAYAICMAVILAYLLLQVSSATYAADLSSQYASAMNWMSMNTAPNASVLTFFADAAPIEFLQGKVTYTDGWGGYNNTLVDRFANFLFARECNFTYINTLKPDYLLVNIWWISKNNSANSSAYGYEYDQLLSETSIPSPSLNGSNLEMLEGSNSSILYNDTVLKLIYNQNYTRIYQVDFVNTANTLKGVCYYVRSNSSVR